MCISFPPYFDHDAFMHHPMLVLDAPDSKELRGPFWGLRKTINNLRCTDDIVTVLLGIGLSPDELQELVNHVDSAGEAYNIGPSN